MPTFVIVNSSKTPLNPGEINAGQSVSVNAGDVFVIDPSADANVTFASSSGGPHGFEILFAATNTNTFAVTTQGGLNPTVTINDNVRLDAIDIDAQGSESLTLNAGDNASLAKLDGADSGTDAITVGDTFSAFGDWSLRGGDDAVIIGNDATLLKVKTGSGNDTVTIGDRAQFDEVDGESGNDQITFGDDATGNKIKAGDGNDTVSTGNREQVTTVDGEGGTDSYTTQTAGTTTNSMESVSVICFGPDTWIDTPDGARAIETLTPGDLVTTLDHGAHPIRWMRRIDQRLDGTMPEDKPVLIKAGALGPGHPAQDLVVSPQHRLLAGGAGQLMHLFAEEVFAPAKALTGLPGIRSMRGKRAMRWVHFAFDRHEIIKANGCYAESLLLGPMLLNGLDRATLHTLVRTFGPSPMPQRCLNGPAARPVLSVGMVRRRITGQIPSHADTKQAHHRQLTP